MGTEVWRITNAQVRSPSPLKPQPLSIRRGPQDPGLLFCLLQIPTPLGLPRAPQKRAGSKSGIWIHAAVRTCFLHVAQDGNKSEQGQSELGTPCLSPFFSYLYFTVTNTQVRSEHCQSHRKVPSVSCSISSLSLCPTTREPGLVGGTVWGSWVGKDKRETLSCSKMVRTPSVLAMC